MITCRRFAKFCALLFLIQHYGFAQAEESDTKANLFDLSLEELLSVRIDVASFSASRISQQPAVITVFNQSELQALGARDVADVLYLVPGFEFALDVMGSIGPTMRGLWSQEGKIALIVDDMVMNDLLYGSGLFAGQYPIDNIERLEIIRGPGAARFGGNAQTAVIRITTKRNDFSGETSIAVSSGMMSNNTTQQTASFNHGNRVNEFRWSISGLVRKDNASVGTFTDVSGISADTEAFSEAINRQLDFSISSSNLEARLHFNRFRNEHVDYFGNTFVGHQSITTETGTYDFEAPVHHTYEDLAALIRYEHSFSDDWQLQARYQYLDQYYWINEAKDGFDLYTIPTNKQLLEIVSNFLGSEGVRVVVGAQLSEDSATAETHWEIPVESFFKGSQSISYTESSLFAELTKSFTDWTIIAGLRSSKHDYSGSATLPRLSAIWSQKKWHAKFMYSEAFRHPNIQVINDSYRNIELDPFGYMSPAISSETTSDKEFELGFNFADNSIATIVLFETAIEDPIIYDVGSDIEFGYANSSLDMSTKGVELEYRMQAAWGSLWSTYSYYSATELPASYQSRLNPTSALAAANHKISVNSNLKLSDDWSINANVIWLSSRSAYDFDELTSSLVEKEFSDTTIANLTVRFEPEPTYIELSVRDALDEQVRHLQAYGLTPLPSREREFIVRAGITF